MELDDFTIRFDMSQPIRWSNPAGTSPSLWDPENNQGITHAVIDTRDSNSNENRDVITLDGMTIYGPPAFDGSTYSGLQATLAQSGDTTHEYVGEQAIDLVRANDEDSGTITDSTFQGGAIEVFGGPWTITDNTVLGSTADTYSPGAFELHSPFDALIEGNQVTQSDPAGREFRLVVLADSGVRQHDPGQHVRGRGRPDRRRDELRHGLGPVHRHQRPRGDPGREHLRRAVRGAAGGGLGGRPAAGPHRISASARPPS